MSEQNFEQNKRFLRALPAGRISHFTSRIYPSLTRVVESKTNLLMAKKSSKEYSGVFLMEGKKFNLGEKN